MGPVLTLAEKGRGEMIWTLQGACVKPSEAESEPRLLSCMWAMGVFFRSEKGITWWCKCRSFYVISWWVKPRRFQIGFLINIH